MLPLPLSFCSIVRGWGMVFGIKIFCSLIRALCDPHSHEVAFLFQKTVFPPVCENLHLSHQDDPRGTKRRIKGTAAILPPHPQYWFPICANSLPWESGYSVRVCTIGCILPLFCRFLPGSLLFLLTVHSTEHQILSRIHCSGFRTADGISFLILF